MTIEAGAGIEAAIQAWWTNTVALDSLLPAASVYTDQVEDEAVNPPYVAVLISSDLEFATASAEFYLAQCVFEIHYSLNENAAGRVLAETLRDQWKDFAASTVEIETSCPIAGSIEKPDETSGRKHFTVTNQVRYGVKR